MAESIFGNGPDRLAEMIKHAREAGQREGYLKGLLYIKRILYIEMKKHDDDGLILVHMRELIGILIKEARYGLKEKLNDS